MSFRIKVDFSVFGRQARNRFHFTHQKISIGQHRAYGFLGIDIILSLLAILGVTIFEIQKFFLLKITFGLVPIGAHNKKFLAGQPILTYSNS